MSEIDHYRSGMAPHATGASTVRTGLPAAVTRALRGVDRSRLLTLGLCGLAAQCAADPLLDTLAVATLYPAQGGDGSVGVVFQAKQTTTLTGSKLVEGLGDVNHDAFGDFAVRSASGFGCYVVYGESQFPPLRREADLNGTWGFTVIAHVASGCYGCDSIDGANDVNGDGIDDFVLDDAIVFGKDGPFPAPLDIRTLPQGVGTRVVDTYVFNARGRGDFNGDGNADAAFVVRHQGGGDAEVVTIFGRADLPAEIHREDLDGQLGVLVSDAGVDIDNAAIVPDINGDGLDELLIGSESADGSSRGAAYLVFGSAQYGRPGAPALIDLATLNGDNGFTFRANGPQQLVGASVGSGGDFDGDGLGELVIGARGSFIGPGCGAQLVLFGHTGAFPASIDVGDLDGGNGFLAFAQDTCVGKTHVGAGDFNADGYGDLLVATGAKKAYVVYGHPSPFASLLAIDRLPDCAGLALLGLDNSPENFGEHVGAAGDVNGDGIDDMLVGAHPDYYDSARRAHAYLIFGQDARDSDFDCHADSEDDCVLIPDNDQRDTDGDGIGNVCDADLNGDCIVNFEDLGRLRSVFFSSDPDADFDGSGEVNFEDLSIMKQSFYGPPGPSGVPNVCE